MLTENVLFSMKQAENHSSGLLGGPFIERSFISKRIIPMPTMASIISGSILIMNDHLDLNALYGTY